MQEWHGRLPRGHDLQVIEGPNPVHKPLKLFAGAGGLDHAAPEPGWTVDSCASSCLTNKANKPTEEVFHMGVEEFVVMCQAIDQLQDQMQLDSNIASVELRDVVEGAAHRFTSQGSGLKAFLRDVPSKNCTTGTEFELNNKQAVKDVLEVAKTMGTFAERHAYRVQTRAEFDDAKKPDVMKAINTIYRKVPRKEAAASKAEIEALHLDELFVDVYLPHFMQV